MCPQLCQLHTNLEYKAQNSAFKELKYGSGDSTILLNKLMVFIQLCDAITQSFLQQVFIESYYMLDILLGVRDIAVNKTYKLPPSRSLHPNGRGRE